jgi:hypothetical protein
MTKDAHYSVVYFAIVYYTLRQRRSATPKPLTATGSAYDRGHSIGMSCVTCIVYHVCGDLQGVSTRRGPLCRRSAIAHEDGYLYPGRLQDRDQHTARPEQTTPGQAESYAEVAAEVQATDPLVVHDRCPWCLARGFSLPDGRGCSAEIEVSGSSRSARTWRVNTATTAATPSIFLHLDPDSGNFSPPRP